MDSIDQHLPSKAYAALRESIGSQGKVSKLLGVTVQTLSRRENSEKPVSREAVMALLFLRGLQSEEVPSDPQSAHEPATDPDRLSPAVAD